MFPRRGVPTLGWGGGEAYDFAKFSKKKIKIEKILGLRTHLAFPLRSTTANAGLLHGTYSRKQMKNSFHHSWLEVDIKFYFLLYLTPPSQFLRMIVPTVRVSTIPEI